ncbi:PepSY domain-containing protein [Aquabacterium sp. CECT 9606]|uniref:PepSY domain-containing protein n=1 Tax=Aquabacterium sp. CECT 9606 TaxID=2845822 RepID=UPI001E35D026|nr:PepSY domain-containing protein [Aquabacterium sp. CECT 9606]
MVAALHTSDANAYQANSLISLGFYIEPTPTFGGPQLENPMLTTHKFALLGITVITGLAATAAYAAGHIEAVIQAITQAKLTLGQAIAAAEQSTPGSKATHADFERDRQGHWVFTVEVAKAGEALDVMVDPANGKVLSVTRDLEDREDNEDERE